MSETSSEQGQLHEKPEHDRRNDGVPASRILDEIGGAAGNVNNMIGSGIFSTSAIVWQETGSTGISLILWLVGGIISLFGSMTYSALGSKFPESGGETVYLHEAYPKPTRLFSYIFTFTALTAIRPSIITADCNIVAQYLIFSTNSTQTQGCNEYLHPNYLAGSEFWALRGISLGVLWLITFYHIKSAKWADRIARILAVFKSLAVITLAIIGFTIMHNSLDNWQEAFQHSSTNVSFGARVGSITRAMFLVLFAYEGWNNLNYSLDEFREEGQLLLANTLSVVFVTILYLLANIAYISVISKDSLPKCSNNADEVIAGEFSFIVNGRVGGIILSLSICLSAFGAVASMIWSSARIIVAAARVNYIPRFSPLLRKLNDDDTPVNALLAQAIWCTIIIIFAPGGTDPFRFLIVSAQYGMWIFYTLTCLGLIVMNLNGQGPTSFKKVYPFTVIFVLFGTFIILTAWIPPDNSDAYPYQFWEPYVFLFSTMLVGLIFWKVRYY